MDLLRLFLAYILLFFGLGWLVIPILFKSDDFSFLDKCAISFSLSVGTICVLGTVFYFLGNNLLVVQSSLLILLVVVSLVRVGGWWRGKRGGKNSNNWHRRVGGRLGDFSKPTLIIISFAVFCSLLALWTGPWLSHTADSFMHMAAVRRLINTGQVLNTGVYFAWESPGLVPQTGTWNLALALLSSFSMVDITRIWLHLPALLTPVYILSFHAFASTLFKNHKLAALVTVLYFVLHHKLDFRVLAYPNRISHAILWIALLFTLRYLGTGKKKYLCLASGLGFVLSTMHLFTIELFLLSISSYALFRLLFRLKKGIFSDCDLKRALAVIVVTLVLASPFVVFKLTSSKLVVDSTLRNANIHEIYKDAFRHSLSLGEKFFIVDPAMLFPHPVLFKRTPLPKVGARGELVLFAYLLMFFFIPTCLKGKRAEIFLLANMTIVPLIIFNPFLLYSFAKVWVPDLAVFRLAYEMPPSVLVFGFFLYQWLAGLTRSGDEDLNGTRRRERWRSKLLPAFFIGISLFCAISSTLGGPVVGGAVEIYNPFSTYISSAKVAREGRLVNWEEPFSFIMHELPKDAVVLSDPVSSYYIAGLTGRFIISVPPTHQEFEYEFRLFKGPEGRRDIMSVLDQDTDLKTTVSLLRKWDADYIFVDLSARGVASLSPRSKFDRYPALFRGIYEKGDVSIYEYNWEALALAVAEMDIPSENCLELDTRLTNDLILVSSCLDDRLLEADKYIALKLAWKPLREFSNAIPIELRFSGVNSGHVFSATFDLGENAEVPLHLWEPNNVYEEAYVTFMPADVALDAYKVSINKESQTSQEEVVLGQFGLRETYQAESFRGIIRPPQTEGPEDFSKYSGWIRYRDYAVTRDLGAIMVKDIRSIPPGDYQVLLQVYNHENQGVNQVEVTLNGVKRVIEWDGSKGGGEEWVGAVFDNQGGGSELSITSLKREQWYIVISEVAIVPLMAER